MKNRHSFLLIILAVLVLAYPIFIGFSPCHIELKQENIKIAMPIIMYHQVLKGKSGMYIVTPEQLESDLKMFKAQGFNFVLPSQMIDFVEGKGELPKKPILICFDDGHYNNIYYAYPLLKKYQAKALFNIIGVFSNNSSYSGSLSNPDYSHMTWSEIRNLNTDECMELGNHSYNMHNYRPRFGISKLPEETTAQYIKTLTDDIMHMQSKMANQCGVIPTVFAYPFGKYTVEGQQLLPKLGFKMTLNCNEGVTKIKWGEPKSLFDLRRINRSGLLCSTEILLKIKKYS